MNSNPYALPAFIVCVAALLVCAAWAFLAITRQPATGQHARRRDPGDEVQQFAGELRAPPPVTHEPPGDGWWDEQPPPPAAEILTGPGTRIPQTSEVTIGTLARVRDALMPDAWRPEPGQVTFTAADPDATCTDLPAVTGGYLPAPQPAGQLEVTP